MKLYVVELNLVGQSGKVHGVYFGNSREFYRTTVRPAVLYDLEFQAIKKVHGNKLNIAEMRTLRRICGKTRKDKIRNKYARGAVEVTH